MHLGRGLVIVSVALCSTILSWNPGVASAAAWPGESWAAATDLTSLNPSGWATNLSGAYWNPATRRLWVCTNGPARFWSLAENGTGGFVIERPYTGSGDLEAITQIAGAPNVVFLLDEAARTIRSYRISDGAALTTWLLGTIPDFGNSGPEGLAFVPNSWLAQNHFVSGSGAPYEQSVHGANGFGGLMFVAVQTSGWVYAFDLKTDGTSTFVGRYLTSRTESCELTFDSSLGRMYVLHNISGNWIEITDLTSTISGSDRRLVSSAEVQVPSTSNIEGLAMTPALAAPGIVGDNWCFFTDDDNASGALRWFQQLHAQLSIQAGDGQTAPAGTALPLSPSVRVRDPFANALPGVPITYAVASGGGVITGGSVVTDGNGVAAVESWTLGPNAGENRLDASGAGLGGSPVTFTATATPPLFVPHDGAALALGSPVPNPGRDEVRISFTVPDASPATLEVFDVRGRLVSTIARREHVAGPQVAVWDGRHADGTPAASGVYFYRLCAGNVVLSRRGLLLR